LRAVERVKDRSRNLGEVSVAHFHRRHSEELTSQPAFFESLEVRHEKEPVLPVVNLRNPNRATEREAVLVPPEQVARACTGKCRRPCIELVVAQELEKGSVELIRSRLGRNIDLRGSTPELRWKDSSLDLELLQRIDRRQEDIAVEVHIRILDAVQGKVVELAP